MREILACVDGEVREIMKCETEYVDFNAYVCVLLLGRATIGQAVNYINKGGREAYDDVIPSTLSSSLSTGYMCGLAYARGVGANQVSNWKRQVLGQI